MASEEIFQGVLWFCVLLFSLTFHEFGHAWMANRCGDPTAKYLGRLTLNPLAHADPVGTFLFPLIQIFMHVPLIGWAKPVPFNPANLRHPGRDDVLISLAGPGANIILALCAALLWRLDALLFAATTDGFLHTLAIFTGGLLPMLMKLNIWLAVFNLIPFPPLDGSWVVYHLLPGPLAERYRIFGARYGFLVILALFYTGVARTFISAGYAVFDPVLRVVSGS